MEVSETVEEVDKYAATVDWLPTYDYAAKHRNPVENDFECPCPLCPGRKGKHRA